MGPRWPEPIGPPVDNPHRRDAGERAGDEGLVGGIDIGQAEIASRAR